MLFWQAIRNDIEDFSSTYLEKAKSKFKVHYNWDKSSHLEIILFWSNCGQHAQENLQDYLNQYLLDIVVDNITLSPFLVNGEHDIKEIYFKE